MAPMLRMGPRPPGTHRAPRQMGATMSGLDDVLKGAGGGSGGGGLGDLLGGILRGGGARSGGLGGAAGGGMMGALLPLVASLLMNGGLKKIMSQLQANA